MRDIYCKKHSEDRPKKQPRILGLFWWEENGMKDYEKPVQEILVPHKMKLRAGSQICFRRSIGTLASARQAVTIAPHGFLIGAKAM